MLVKDKSTQKLKGTAFVEYERPEDAQRAADACAKARSAPPGLSLYPCSLRDCVPEVSRFYCPLKLLKLLQRSWGGE